MPLPTDGGLAGCWTLDYAAAIALVIVSADSDFGELLAASRGATRPSVVLLRSADRLTPDEQAALLVRQECSIIDVRNFWILVYCCIQ